jgi:TrmH family RNA methyltransferase
MTDLERPDSRAISSPTSDRVKKIAALSGRSARRKQGRARDLALDVYLTADGAQAHPDLVDLAEGAGIFRHTVSGEVLRAMADDVVTPQGVLAVCRVPAADEEADPAPAALPIGPMTVLVLVGVQDPGNVGTLIRTADASGCDLVLATTGTADVFAPKTVRASAGSIFHLPVITGIAPGGLHALLRRADLSVLATSGYGDSDLYGAMIPPRTAWLVGNEAQGLPADLLGQADLTVRIPLGGKAESLNVQAAATVCLFETRRRRLQGGAPVTPEAPTPAVAP